MSLHITVTIPRSYLIDQLNVGSPQDVLLYEESIAFAFTDRWDVADLQFEYSDVATAHFFDCQTTVPDEAKPSDNDFTVALQAAVERYRFSKTGDPGTFLRAGSTALEYLFTPLMTNSLDEPPPVSVDEPEP